MDIKRNTGQTNKERYDEKYLKEYGMTYYQYIGSRGGKAKTKKGFALVDSDKHKEWSAKGGKVSRRGKNNPAA